MSRLLRLILNTGNLHSLIVLIKTADCTVKRMNHYLGSSIDSLFNSRCLMSGYNRLVADETHLYQTALIINTRFIIAVLIAQMDFHPCNPFAETVKEVPYNGFSILVELITPFNITIGIDLYLHENNRLLVLYISPAKETERLFEKRNLDFSIPIFLSKLSTIGFDALLLEQKEKI
jgi:hypothetical protein